MFRTLILLTALSLASNASAEDFFWDRLEKLMSRQDFEIVTSTDTLRRGLCITCEDEVLVTIFVQVRSSQERSQRTVQDALKAYRTQRCSDLITSGKGRCVKPNLIELNDGRVIHEAVLLYAGDIILGQAEGSKGSPDLLKARGPWLKHLLESLTPLY